MVLSLFDLCRISIRDSIEEGKLRDVGSLPPILRQSVLDMILMHRTINNPNCLSTLSSVDFLRGLTSFNTQRGKIDDDRYLKRVRKSMRSIDSNGTTIGSSIEELRLNFYGIDHDWSRKLEETNFRSVIQLIKECVNLKVLHLGMHQTGSDATRATETDDDDPESEEEESESLTIFKESASGGLLNNCVAMEPCLSVMENLNELSLDGFPGCAPFLLDHYSIIKFKNLRKLRLHYCKVEKAAWRRFLKSIRNTLISLDFELIHIGWSVWEIRNNDFPVPLPHLKSLITDTYVSKTFLDNLADCKELDYVCLKVSADNEEADLLALNRMNCFQLEVHVSFTCQPIAYESFKLIDIFKEKVTKFVLRVEDKNVLFATALEHVVDVCPNLVKFHLLIDSAEEGVLPRESERINSALVRLFSDEERASKILDLNLDFDVDFEVLTSVFRNCVNVKSLDVSSCTRLCDDHLVDWALRGARPSDIFIYGSPNVGDAGLIPILISSGECLEEISIWANYRKNLVNVGERTWRVLADHCRYVVRISGIPAMLNVVEHKLVEEKCFNKNVFEFW